MWYPIGGLYYILEYRNGPHHGVRYATFQLTGPDTTDPDNHRFVGRFRHDFNNDHFADAPWKAASGTLAMWTDTQAGNWEIELWAEEDLTSKENRRYHRIRGDMDTTYFFGSRATVSYLGGEPPTRGPSEVVHSHGPPGPDPNAW